ncbi:hypothetical protein EDEG_03430, partial [Edhazardia aedis USNM 41457]
MITRLIDKYMHYKCKKRALMRVILLKEARNSSKFEMRSMKLEKHTRLLKTVSKLCLYFTIMLNVKSEYPGMPQSQRESSNIANTYPGEAHDQINMNDPDTHSHQRRGGVGHELNGEFNDGKTRQEHQGKYHSGGNGHDGGRGANFGHGNGHSGSGSGQLHENRQWQKKGHGDPALDAAGAGYNGYSPSGYGVNGPAAAAAGFGGGLGMGTGVGAGAGMG